MRCEIACSAKQLGGHVWKAGTVTFILPEIAQHREALKKQYSKD